MAKLSITEALKIAINAHKSGDFNKAYQYLSIILKNAPNHPDANHNMGVLAISLGERKKAIPFFKKAIDANPSEEQYWLSYVGLLVKLDQKSDAEKIFYKAKANGLSQILIDKIENLITKKDVNIVQNRLNDKINKLSNLYIQGKLEVTINEATKLTKKFPDSYDIWNILGLAAARTGKLEKAILAFKELIKLNPNSSDAYNNIGNVLKLQGKPLDSIKALTKAINIKPDHAEAHNNLGNALRDQFKLDTARKEYEKAILYKPDFAEAYFNLGNIFQEQGKFKKALNTYNKVISLNPDNAYAYNNIGIIFYSQGKFNDAITSYKKALTLKPDYHEVFYNMGNAYKNQDKFDDSVKSYSKAISLKPNYVEAYNNMGNVFKDMRKLNEAVECYISALLHKPDYVDSLNNLGHTKKDQGKLDEAVEYYKKSLFLKPENELIRSQKMHLQAHICDWSDLDVDYAYLVKLGIKGFAVTPFSLLSFEDDPTRHRLRSENYSQKNLTPITPSLTLRQTKKRKRLRIGYFSADFQNHATMYLMAQVFCNHNKSQFKIFAYSYGHENNDIMRKKLMSAVDNFHDIQKLDDAAVVDLVRNDEIDIAVDLKGFTRNSRLSIFANRLAPIQISYLGYPGTTGSKFIDYIIADHMIIPEKNQKYYVENIIYLPNTYQPTDNTRQISESIPSKEEMGLPSDGFVFCCFNNSYKISPKEFDIWMRLLGKIDNSVLWLLKSNKWVEKNLKREAELRGVDAKRLVFAENTRQSDHLARHKVADLFLDTFNVNAHTSASDALWAGLPIVTKLGKGFAARVAGSLLKSIGLNELITNSSEQYESLIFELATNTEYLSHIRSKLDGYRFTKPLFDSEMYTKHLEQGYKLAFNRHLDALQPSTIIVPK